MSSCRIGSWVVLALGWLAVTGCAEDPSPDDPSSPGGNRPPVVAGLFAITEVNVPVVIDLLAGASDPDGDPLTVSHVTVFGATFELLPDNRNLRFTPTSESPSPISVQYVVDDGHFHDVIGHVAVTVTPAGHPPIAQGDELSVAANVPRSFTLLATDPDGQALTFTIVTQPEHGTLSGTAPNLVYAPAADFVGADRLGFSVSDGELTSAVAYVTLIVSRENRAPVATPLTVAATEDTAAAITLAGADPDGDAVFFEIQIPPTHGVLTGVRPNLTYLPSTNYHGPDSFSFAVRDFRGVLSPPATVSIDVAAVNDAPVATAQQRNLNEDQPLAITLAAGDADGDALGFAIATGPAHGTLTGTPPNVTYQPAADYHGADAFTFTASDGTAVSQPATITLSVASVNDAPVALDSAVTTDEEVAVAIALQASDVDGDALTYTVVSRPPDGLLSGIGANRTYTPASNATGTRTLTFQVSDGITASRLATVTITIQPLPDPPVAVDDYVATDPGQALTVDLTSNDLDVDGEPLTISALGTPAHGTAELIAGKLRYTPAAGFTGVDVFAYTLTDPAGLTATASVHVGVGAFPPGAPLEAVLALAVDPADPRNAPSLSSDGRFVAFTTMFALDPADTNGVTDIYLYDRGDRSVSRVSQPSAGGATNGASRNPHISSNGRFIVFESIASTLVPGDSNAALDVFRHDRITGETVRVSVATGGGQASGASTEPKISDDGSRVVFSSTAFDLVANDANGASDIFVRDLVAGTTTRVSVSSTGGEGDLAAVEPAISGDGRLVAFTSAATNLTAGDTNHVSDVFVRDLAAGTTTRVSVSSTGGEANSLSAHAWLSQDGRFVSFVSSATNLVTGGFGTQAYVRDTQAQTTTRPVASSGVQFARLSGDGRYLATLDDSGVKLCDRFAAVTVSPVGAGRWQWPSWSRDGRYLVVIDATPGGTLAVTSNPL
jgi:Tol biopolymer transport system component